MGEVELIEDLVKYREDFLRKKTALLDCFVFLLI